MLGWLLLDTATGALVPARCRRNGCGYCLTRNARRRAAAIALAAPERAILLTQVGDSWQVVRDRLKRLAYDVRREVGPFEWTTHVEPNPAGTGHHVHAWQHGNYVPQRTLSQLAARRGMGAFVRINRIRSRKGAAAYGLKGLGYGLKGVEADDAGAEYLRCNGNRLTHQSRGFFRSVDGARLPVRVAERLAVGAMGGESTWVLVRAGSVGTTPTPA